MVHFTKFILIVFCIATLHIFYYICENVLTLAMANDGALNRDAARLP